MPDAAGAPLADLLAAARAWAADDPDAVTRAELDGLADAAEGRGRRGRDRAGRRDGRDARVRHRRPARPPRRRAQPDEPRRRDPRGRRAHGLPEDPRPRAVRRRRLRRPHQLRRLRARHLRRRRRHGRAGRGAPPPAADPGAGVRDPPPRRGCRRHGHRVAQPARGQRLQGLRRRRLADRAAGRRADRRRDREGLGPWPTCRGPTTAGTPSTTRCSTPTSPTCARSCRRTARARSPWCTPRCTAWGPRRCARRSSRPATRRRSRWRRRPSPTRCSPRCPSPTRRSPGAMDAALELAEQTSPDVVIANDPDADRCAVAVPGPGGWRMLRGDEVGALLGSHVLSRGAAGGVLPDSADCVFANSIVSSRLLAAMCRAAGVRHEETLTGFKWIGRVPGLRYGYEEALGYCVDPERVRDKDGVSAALLVAELVATLRTAGPLARRPARRPGAGARGARHRRVLGAGRGPVAHRPDHGAAAGRPADLGGGGRRGPGRRPRAGRRRAARRPRACATSSPTTRGSSCGRRAPSPSSRSTSRWSSRSPTGTCAGRASAAATRLAGIRADLEAATAL